MNRIQLGHSNLVLAGGVAKQAIRYRKFARLWDQRQNEDLALTARMLLRAGKLAEACGTVQAAVDQGRPEKLSR